MTLPPITPWLWWNAIWQTHASRFSATSRTWERAIAAIALWSKLKVNGLPVLDSDDWYAPQRLERLVAFAQAMQADMVADLQTYVTPTGKVFMVGWCVHGKIPRRPRYYTPEQVIRYHPSMKPLIRGDFLRQKGIRYASHIRQSQDYAFYVEVLIRGARFALLPEAMYFYQIRPQSITTGYGLGVEQFWLSCEYLCALPETTPAIRKTLLRNFRYRKSWMLYP
jgi:succinoglycan biosynthesis protein ExoO